MVSYIKTFSYTGAAQTWTVPYTGNYKVELWGASGGNALFTYNSSGNAQGGRGGYSKGNTTFSKNTNLYIYVGGAGSTTPIQTHKTTAGGWNGGGLTYGQACCSRSYGSGGGATDIRTVSGTWNNANSLRSRIIVAGSGGGAWAESDAYALKNNGGYGGGLTGGAGANSYEGGGLFCHGLGGNQTSGGAIANISTCLRNYNSQSVYNPGVVTGGFGYGGNSPDTGSSDVGATGGGGGWYGGSHSEHVASAGGGSSYISGHTGSVAVASTSSSSPKSGCTTGTTNNACSISPYGYTFTNTQMIAGNASMPNTAGTGNETGHSGNGYAKITWLGDAV